MQDRRRTVPNNSREPVYEHLLIPARMGVGWYRTSPKDLNRPWTASLGGTHDNMRPDKKLLRLAELQGFIFILIAKDADVHHTWISGGRARSAQAPQTWASLNPFAGVSMPTRPPNPPATSHTTPGNRRPADRGGSFSAAGRRARTIRPRREDFSPPLPSVGRLSPAASAP